MHRNNAEITAIREIGYVQENIAEMMAAEIDHIQEK